MDSTLNLCDVTIEVEDRYLNAHRSVLAATNCQKLKEAIEQSNQDKMESQKSHLNLRLVNLPVNGVVAFLDFIYTGHTHIRYPNSRVTFGTAV